MIADVFFENIQKHLIKKRPFVVYKKPNEDQVFGLLQKDDSIEVVKDFNESGFVFAPFDSNHKAILISSINSENISCTFNSVSSINNIKEYSNSLDLDNQAKINHENLVSKAISAMDNEFHKVVVSRTEKVNLNDTDPLTIFKRLLAKYSEAFCYCWFHPMVGLWLGATPETLVEITFNRLNTMALAGTQIFDNETTVAWSKKEINEQKIVSDYIVETLNDSLDSITVSEAKTIRAGNVLHLKTDISGFLKANEKNLKSILEKLHPTPAVCGFPKEKSKQFILENEYYDRAFYTGFLGELNGKVKINRSKTNRNVENNAYASIQSVSKLFVNLRCMQIKNKEAILYVGGGITKDSNPEKEWLETVHKAQTMKQVLV